LNQILQNNREPLFRRSNAAAIFEAVLYQSSLKFDFEIRGLFLGDDRLEFHIKPVEGTELPAIMKWLKQTFAQRYNPMCRKRYGNSAPS
jgi:REP element-mobilizing transposase RayT